MYVPPGDGTGTCTHLSSLLVQPFHSTVILIMYPLYAGAVDIGAVVCEIGAYAARLGFAGEDQPRSYFPSVSLLTPLWCLNTCTLQGSSRSYIFMYTAVWFNVCVSGDGWCSSMWGCPRVGWTWEGGSKARGTRSSIPST